MHQRIAIAFRRRCKNERGFFVLGQAERVVGPKRADFQCWDRQLEVINRAGWRREMKHVIQSCVRQKNKIGDVVLDEMKIWTAGEIPDVRRIAGNEIIDRDDAVTVFQKTVG